MKVYYNDFDGNGSGDLVLSKKLGTHRVPVRGRECSSQQMSFIAERFPDFQSFANASLEEVYSSEKLKSSVQKEATIFESVILENLGEGRFDVIQLPNEAQLSPINASIITDVNQDGFLDLVAAGNMFTSETPAGESGRFWSEC